MAVTNRQILDALIEMGYDPAQINAIPVTGAQGSKFQTAVFKVIGGIAAGGDEAFARAKQVAAWRPDPKRSAMDNFVEAMRVRGIDIPANMERIAARATQLKRSRPGISPPGQRFSERDFYDAAVEVLGATPQVATAMRAVGIAHPVAAPAPTAPQRLGGPRMRITGPTTPERGLRPGAAPRTATPAAPAAPGAPGAAARAVTAGGGGGGGGGEFVGAPAVADLTPALGPNATEDEVRRYVNEHYGQWAYLYDVPELKAKVIRPAVEQGWDADRILGALQTTQWWLKTEPAARVWKELKHTDPAEAADRVHKKFLAFSALARERGITGIPEHELREMAEDSLEFDWDDNETTAAMGRWFRYDPNNLMGQANDTAVALRQLHKSYLIPLSDATVGAWTTRVIRGEATPEDFEDYLRIQAKALFPMLSAQIDLGVTPDQWVDPYRQLASQTLGLAPEAIDFRDPKWLAALDETDPKTNQRRPMYLNDWVNKLKTDAVYGWDKTAQGREHGARLARTLASTFGRS
jgi:hypothetical protein